MDPQHNFQLNAAFLDALFEDAPVGLGIWDAELRYLRLNQALADIDGVPIEDHLGRTMPEGAVVGQAPNHRTHESDERGDGLVKPTRLVICDDVDDIRMLMRVAFDSDDDFEVVGEASNGEEGIAATEEHKPDAVLLDINMPVKGGLEALPTIRELVTEAAIVIFSGFEEWSLGEQARDVGADAYVEKGTEVGEILELVRGVVQERRRARAGDGS